MKAESHSQGDSLHLAPLSEHNVLVPPCVKAIAVRLSWVATGDEAVLYQLLCAPYYHDGLTSEDLAQLSARLPFLATQKAPLAIADYTIMLVTVWLNIEELYHRGIVMPEQIMQGLMQKTATMSPHDCREVDLEQRDIYHPQRC